MNFEDLHGPIDLNAENRWDAIDELVNHLAAIRQIKKEDSQPIIASVRKRESSMTTGIGFSIAIPHAATDLVTEVVGVVGRSKKGLQFDAVDGQLVNLVILFLVPQGDFQKHLNTLANLARMLHRDDFRDGLRKRFL